jgi:ABC-type transporter Mla MlaB component
MPFSIVSLELGVTRIALEGDLDVFTIESLRPELASVVRQRPAQVKVDLSRLRWVHTRGMETLVSFFAHLARAGCRISVTELQAQPLGCLKAALVDAIVHASELAN